MMDAQMTPRFSEYSDIPGTVLRELEAELSHKDKRGHREIVRREIEKRERLNRDRAEGACPHGMSSRLRCSTCNGY